MAGGVGHRSLCLMPTHLIHRSGRPQVRYEIAVLVAGCLDPRAIHRQQLSAEQIQLLAQQHELAKHRAEGVAIIAAEVGDGLEIGLQVPQQPDHLDIPVGLGFEPVAGADAVEVTIYIDGVDGPNGISVPQYGP